MKDFSSKIKEHLMIYKENDLNIFESGTYNHKGTIITHHKHILPNSIDNNKILDNFLPMAKKDFLFWGKPNKKIELHRLAHHLNSSQVMCINFFAPLIKNETGQCLLLQILKTTEILPVDVESKITEATFEKVISFSEGTNFDFYLKLDTGEQLFFEIKYTEDGFGKTHPDKAHPKKYEAKWEEIYKPHLANSLLLQAMDKDTFYKHYQIWRNVSYIQCDEDYTVFLYPYGNEKAHKDINETITKDDVYNKNVKAIDWNSLVSNALTLSKDTEFYNHFDEFYKKYLAY